MSAGPRRPAAPTRCRRHGVARAQRRSMECGCALRILLRWSGVLVEELVEPPLGDDGGAAGLPGVLEVTAGEPLRNACKRCPATSAPVRLQSWKSLLCRECPALTAPDSRWWGQVRLTTSPCKTTTSKPGFPELPPKSLARFGRFPPNPLSGPRETRRSACPGLCAGGAPGRSSFYA
jgi:hypothetical protein